MKTPTMTKEDTFEMEELLVSINQGNTGMGQLMQMTKEATSPGERAFMLDQTEEALDFIQKTVQDKALKLTKIFEQKAWPVLMEALSNDAPVKDNHPVKLAA